MQKEGLTYGLGLAALVLGPVNCQYNKVYICEHFSEQCKPENFHVMPDPLPPIQLNSKWELSAEISPFAEQSSVSLVFEQAGVSPQVFPLPRVANTALFRDSIILKPADPASAPGGFLSGPACLSMAGIHGESHFGKKPVTLIDKLSWMPGNNYVDQEIVDMPNLKDNKYPWPVWVSIQDSGQVIILNDGRSSDWARQFKRFAYSNITAKATPGMVLAASSMGAAPTTTPRLEAIPAVSATAARWIIAVPHNGGDPRGNIMDCSNVIDQSMSMYPCNSLPIMNNTDLLPSLMALVAEHRTAAGMNPIGRTYLYYLDKAKLWTNSYADQATDLKQGNAKGTDPPSGLVWNKVLLALGNLGPECSHCLLAAYMNTNQQQLVPYSIADDGTVSPLANTKLAMDLNSALGSNPVDSVALGDVTGDGVSEVIASRYSSPTASVYIVTKTALGWQLDSQSPNASIDVSSTAPIQSIAVGDVNADGKADLAFAIPIEKKIAFYINKTATADPINCN